MPGSVSSAGSGVESNASGNEVNQKQGQVTEPEKYTLACIDGLIPAAIDRTF